MTASTHSSHHAHFHRPKHISPALSDLLSSTTIASRTKRKSQPSLPLPVPTLNFPKKSVQKSTHQRTPSQIHKQIANSSASPNLTNISLVRPTPQPGRLRNDLEDPIEQSAITQQQLFSLEYALDDNVDLTPISKPFFQFLRNMELFEDENDLSSDDDDLSSLSSFNSSLSNISPVSFTSPLRGKKSMSLSKPQPKIRSLEALPVDKMSHPLSSVEDCVDDSDLASDSSSEKNKIKKIVSRLGNSLKALRTAASSFSASQQNLLSSSNVFTFQPRSTDEPIPASVSALPIAVSPPDEKTISPTFAASKTRSKIHLQTAAVPKPRTPKPIPLKTYFVQEYALPSKSREVRENSSFYRVYALEGLMRQHGKLDPDFPGKAQVALLPRNDELPARARFPMFHGHWQHDGSNKVPRRWIPICSSDL